MRHEAASVSWRGRSYVQRLERLRLEVGHDLLTDEERDEVRCNHGDDAGRGREGRGADFPLLNGSDELCLREVRPAELGDRVEEWLGRPRLVGEQRMQDRSHRVDFARLSMRRTRSRGTQHVDAGVRGSSQLPWGSNERFYPGTGECDSCTRQRLPLNGFSRRLTINTVCKT